VFRLAQKAPNAILAIVVVERSLIMRASFSNDYELVIRQKPLAAKVFTGKEKGAAI
jgi:hypothetical protein